MNTFEIILANNGSDAKIQTLAFEVADAVVRNQIAKSKWVDLIPLLESKGRTVSAREALMYAEAYVSRMSFHGKYVAKPQVTIPQLEEWLSCVA